MEKEIMSPKIDVVFKQLMKNDLVRKGFLSAVLNIKDTDITSTQIVDIKPEVFYKEEEQELMDITLTMYDELTLSDKKVNIEIQIATLDTWQDRSTFYVMSKFSEPERFILSKLRKCISINILDFKLSEEYDKYHLSYHFAEDNHNIVFKDAVEIHHIELPKLPADSDGSPLYDWVKFLVTDNREDFEKLAEKNIYLREAYKELDKISQDEQEQLEYDERKRSIYYYNETKQKNYEKGFAEGKAQERKHLEEILKSLGKTDEQIKDLIENQ